MKYKYKISNRKSQRGGANNSGAVTPGNNTTTGGATNNAAGAPPPGANNSPAPPPAGNTPPVGNNAPANLAGNKPANNKPANNKPANNKPANNKPANNQPVNNQAAKNNSGSLKNNMANAVASGLGKASNLSNNLVGKAGNMFSKGKNTATAAVGKVYRTDPVKIPYYNDIITKVIMMVILLAIFYGFLVLMNYIIRQFLKHRSKSVPLFDMNKDSKHNHLIPNDLILRSENQDGMEFTYSFWIYIMSLNYKPGEWKHIMHKGSATSYPNRAPGVWLHPTKNSLRVYMNTFDNPTEYVDVDDIPIKKWVCIQLVLQNINSHTTADEDIVDLDNNQVLDIYINGQNKKTMLFKSVPKQNNGDLYINQYGGYDGFFSRLKYYPYAVEFKQIGALVKEGPSKKTTETGEIPPYLNDSWWFDYNPDTEYQV